MSWQGIDGRIRCALFVLSGVIFLVIPTELLLHEHTESRLQLIPFALCGLGIVAVVVARAAPRRMTLYGLRGIMLLIMAGSLLGVYEHLSGNFAFELEIRPNAVWTDVIMDAFMGANPFLAPGMLAVGAAMSLIATWYHPKLVNIVT